MFDEQYFCRGSGPRKDDTSFVLTAAKRMLDRERSPASVDDHAVAGDESQKTKGGQDRHQDDRRGSRATPSLLSAHIGCSAVK